MSANPLRAFMILFAIVLLAVFAQSYNGRRDVVQSQRQACLGFDRTALIPLANSLRAMQIQLADNRQASTARVIDRNLRLIDRRIDSGLLDELNPVGRAIVARLKGKAFSCRSQYPAASPFQFFG